MSEAATPLNKMLRLFQLIAVLKSGKWTIKQLVDRFDSSKSSMYRYLQLLDEAGFCLEKDFHDRYFILTTDDDPIQSQFTMEELGVMRSLLLSDVQHPLKSSLLKKLSMNSALDAMPRLFLKAHLGNLVEALALSMRNKHQVILKNYQSANSGEVRNRNVEPIAFNDNYTSISAFDIEDLTTKQFKLDRIAEVFESHKPFQFESLHVSKSLDAFGLAGEESIIVTLKLSLRAFLLMREEFPLTLPYLKKQDNHYIFNGPVHNYKGVGRFVMGLYDEVEVVAPEEFGRFIEAKFKPIKVGFSC